MIQVYRQIPEILPTCKKVGFFVGNNILVAGIGNELPE